MGLDPFVPGGKIRAKDEDKETEENRDQAFHDENPFEVSECKVLETNPDPILPPPSCIACSSIKILKRVSEQLLFISSNP